MLYEIIENNFVGTAIALFLILFILTNNNFEKKINRRFLAAAFCVLILIIEEAWEAQLALNTAYMPPRTLLSAIGYSLRPMIPYLLVGTLENHIDTRAKLFALPLVLNAAVVFSALFCKLTYWYTPDNQFMRGPLGFTPFWIAGFYVFVLLVLTIRGCRDGGFVEALIVSAIVLLAFLSTIMESLFQFQFIQNPCIATSITFYYLFLHSNRSNRDPLTGALVRRRFYLDAEKRGAALSAVISLDLNDLKRLNDQCGHMEGDKALIATANLMKKHMGVRTALYRTGGDEFMILCYRMSEAQVQEIVKRLRSDFEKTEYRCAIGYALFLSQMSFDQVCQIADNAMYENKRQMKAAEEGGRLKE